MKTKIQHFSIYFLLLQGLLFAPNSGSSSVSPGLENSISKLSIISRLVNAIVLQSSMLQTQDDVIAELLNAPSGELIAKLKMLMVDDVANEVEEFQTILSANSSLTILAQAQIEQTDKLVSLLNNIFENQELKTFRHPGQHDPSIELEQLMNSAPGQDYFDLEVFNNSANILSVFKERADSEYNNQSLTSFMVLAEQKLGNGEKELEKFEKSDTDLEQFYKILNAPSLLKSVGEFVKVSRIFFLFFNEFLNAKNSTQQFINGLEPNLNVFDSLYKDDFNHDKLALDLEAAINWMGNLTSPKSLKSMDKKKKLTIGLPRGIRDLGTILDDIKGQTLPKMIGDGKSIKALEEEIGGFVEKFHVAMEKLDEKWEWNKNTSRSNNNSSSGNFLTEARELSEKWKSCLKFPDKNGTQSMKNDMEKLKNCVQNMTAPGSGGQTDSDVQKMTNLEKFVNFQTKRISDFQKTLTSFKSNNSTLKFKEKVIEMINILKSTNLSERARFNELKKFKDLPFAIAKFQEMARRIGGYQNGEKSIFKNVEVSKQDFTVIPRILNSLEGTGFLEALNCTYRESFPDFRKIEKSVNLMKTVEEIKTGKEQVLGETVTFLKRMVEVRGMVLAMSNVTNGGRAGASARRKRSAPNSESIDQPLNLDVGNGMEVLREYLKIVEHKELISNVTNAPSTIQEIAQNAASSKKAWSSENRALTKKLLVELDRLEQKVVQQAPESLKQTWKFFEEAQNVKGPDIDPDLLRDPVSVALRTKGHTEEAEEFETMSRLNLNFAQHHVLLRAATISLRPIQEYFDGMFGIRREEEEEVLRKVVVEKGSGEGKEPSLEVSLGQIIAIIILIMTLGASCLGGYLVYFYLRKAYRWKNRERFWIYSQFFDWTESSQNIFLAIKEDRFETLRRRVVEEDCLVNFYDNSGQTPLHCAMTCLQPEMIELLITNGADRSLHNLEHLTAEQVLDRMPSTAQNAEKMKEVVDVYNRLKGKSFRPRVPDDFPRSRFSVELQCDPKLSEAFRKKYPDCLDSSNSKICTHVVVDTNDEGIFEIDGGGANGEDPDRIAKLYVVFHPAILLKSSWIEACLTSKKNFQKDYDHRVTRVKYRGKTYETVDEWKKWMRWRAIPPLARCHLFCASEIGSAPSRYLRGFAENMGATWLDNPDAVLNQVGAVEAPPPFWFPDKQATWVVYSDGKKDDLETDFVNSKETLKAASKFSFSEFFEMLISMNGWTELEKGKGLKMRSRKEDAQQSSSTSSAITINMTSAPSSLVY